MLKQCLILILAAALGLAGCNQPVYNQTLGNVADVKIKAAQARAKSDNDAKPLPPVVVKPGAYVDTTPISLDKEPSWLSNHIVIRGDQLPFSYYSRTIVTGAGNGNVLTKYQIGLDPSAALSVNYSGTIKGALDMLASKTGYVYTVNRNSIYWQAFITRTFDIAFIPGASDYFLGNKGSQGSTANQSNSGAQVSNYVSSDSSDSEYSNLQGKISIWEDLDLSIKQLMTPDGKVTVSQSTTSVTVRDKPTNVQLIGQFISNLNKNLSRQVLVKIQILEVQLENSFDFGIDWRIIAHAFHNSPFVINGNYGTPVSISALSSQTSIPVTTLANGLNVPPQTNPANPIMGFVGKGIPSYTILLNALNQQGHTSVVSEPRVVCLNNQVSVVKIVNQQGYVASVQNTTVAGGGENVANNTVTSQITPGNLITGLTLYVLPKIMGNDVYLQVNADLSTALPFGTSSGTGASQISLPNISQKHFNQRSKIRSGDTLIMSGMRQVKNIANANQFLTSQALGGKGSTQVNTETIVLITPIVLSGLA